MRSPLATMMNTLPEKKTVLYWNIVCGVRSKLGKNYYKHDLVFVIKSGKVLILTSEDVHLCYMLHFGLRGDMLP